MTDLAQHIMTVDGKFCRPQWDKVYEDPHAVASWRVSCTTDLDQLKSEQTHTPGLSLVGAEMC